MTKKYQTKKNKKNKYNAALMVHQQIQSENYDKQKKITKAPKTKETILSDIQLQIVEMFSRSFTNGQIGVKFPQQKKKGMMRLMNFCFRTILQEVQIYVGSNLKKEAHTAKCIDRKQRTIFHLSSNYRYKHIQKSLLEDFKTVCKSYVKFHCVQHLEVKFLQKFYKKVIYNQYSTDTPQSYKATQAPIVQVQPKQEVLSSIWQQQVSLPIHPLPQIKVSKKKSPKKYKKAIKQQATLSKKKSASKSKSVAKKQKVKTHLKKINNNLSISHLKDQQKNEINVGHLQLQAQVQSKSNKICIQKINIYFGYDAKGHNRKDEQKYDINKIEAHPYARMEVEQNQNKLTKRRWTLDMEGQLIDQFMNTQATTPNIMIRNMMKKFGRNKLFVQSQIQAKRKEMFKVCISKFVDAFVGKTLCSQELIKQMEDTLKNTSVSAKNYFIASFIHDFYFKQVQAISVTLLSEYIHKLNKSQKQIEKSLVMMEVHSVDQQNSERQSLKQAYSTMSKFVKNYTYEIVD